MLRWCRCGREILLIYHSNVGFARIGNQPSAITAAIADTWLHSHFSLLGHSQCGEAMSFLLSQVAYWNFCTSHPCLVSTHCYHFDEIFTTSYTGNYHFENSQCSQWWKFRQYYSDVTMSVMASQITGKSTICSIVKASSVKCSPFCTGFDDMLTLTAITIINI